MSARILVVDNYETTRKMLTYTLRPRGYEVFSYDYASINLAVLEALHPDLLILDFNVRDEDMGWTFLHALKMNDPTANIPILITTTSLQLPQEIKDYLAACHIRVVTKPFDFTALLLLIQNVLTLAGEAGLNYADKPSLPLLIIEDSETVREALATVLRLEGYQVNIADNGRMALDRLNSAEHSLILLDIEMPVMDGFEFLTIYSQQLRSHIRVIILTTDDNVRTKVLPSFVIDVLLKPFEIGHLLQMVEKYA